VLKPVMEVFVTHPDRLFYITIRCVGEDGVDDEDDLGSETLVCTGEHPFWVEDTGEFVSADALAVGNRLRLLDGRAIKVESLEEVFSVGNERYTTYNFEVADYHTYFVGESGVWVHNLSPRWCGELFALFDTVNDNYRDLWKSYDWLLKEAPVRFRDGTNPRWRLRLLNQIRKKHFAGELGSTAAPWRRLSKQKLGLPRRAEHLEANIKSAFGVDKPGSDFTAHHIVPDFSNKTGDLKIYSDRANAVLRKHRIDINEAANGVYLPRKKAMSSVEFDANVYGSPHEKIHTKNYMRQIAERLEDADLAGASPDEIRDILQLIAHDVIDKKIIP
jgi:hypothetical protein